MRHDVRRRIFSAAVLGATLFFWAIVCLAQASRPDLEPLSATLGKYLAGPHGLLLHGAYFALAGAILVFAYVFRAEFAPPRRLFAVTALLVITAAALAAATAVYPGPTAMGENANALREGAHLLASGVSLLAASIALTLAALRLRGAASTAFVRGALALALVENLALLSYVFLRTPWRGAQQKLVIALITAALMAGAAQCLRRRGLAAGKPAD